MKFILALLLASACATDPSTSQEVEVPAPLAKEDSQGVPESEVDLEVTGGCWSSSCHSGGAQLVYLPLTRQYELRVKGEKARFLELGIDLSVQDVEKISLLKTSSQYLVIYQYGSETMSSKVESFDRKDLHKRWALDVPGFNLGFAAKDNALYVSCIDFAGKIDLKKGKYLWRQSGLYKKFDYNGPDHIRIYEREVRFISGTKVIRMSQKDGKILP